MCLQLFRGYLEFADKRSQVPGEVENSGLQLEEFPGVPVGSVTHINGPAVVKMVRMCF